MSAAPQQSPLMRQLVELRKRSGVRQEEIAMDLGVAQGTVARWETGDRHCPIDRLVAYAAIFGLEFTLTLKADSQ